MALCDGAPPSPLSFDLSPAWYTIFHTNKRSSGYLWCTHTSKLLPLLATMLNFATCLTAQT
jgi:hypothetical protein